MSTIYVDVDGTLIDDKDQPREEVVSAVMLMSTRHTIVIWSGGGTQYADTWARRLFPGKGFQACAKFPFSEIFSQDIIVDDMSGEISTEYIDATLLSPEEFVMWALANGAVG